MMKKVLFINQEITPYVPETEIAKAGKDVPQVMLESGCEIRTFMPKWGNINERRGQLHEVIRLSGLDIVINDVDHPTLIKVASIPQTKIQVYFIDNEDFFIKRLMATDEDGKCYKDNGERAIFLARAVLETIKKLHWTPDIIHCQGWMAAFVPFYLKEAYQDDPSICKAKVVTSIFGKQDFAPFADKNLKQCMLYRDITLDTIADMNNTLKAEDLAKMVTKYSDGIIEASAGIEPKVKEVIEKCGRKVLTYQDNNIKDSYLQFYDSLTEE